MTEQSVSTPAPLCLRRVTKRFRQGETTIEALSGASLTVRQGEFVAVMGASGSGKSTLLHVAAGLTQPEQGCVLVDEVDLSTMTDRQLTCFRRRQIGLVFQTLNLVPSLTAEENVLLPILSGNQTQITDEALEELLAELNLADRRHHRPDALSGGEQQRVAIARALITDPAIILADEPTGSLDSVSGQAFCRLLRRLSTTQHRTIVVVTHEPSVAIWASRVVVLKDGRTLAEFNTAEFHGAHGLATFYQAVVGAVTAKEAWA